MDTEKLRDEIWDYLYQERASKSISEIVSLAAVDHTVVRAAVDHEWFSVVGDQVSIAYSSPKSTSRSKQNS